ncbi:MAG: hypothetical protein AB1424_03310 [Thermodesulfobacteriota bacterium]
MTDRMEQLKAEARETAKLRGHKLGRFKDSVITPADGPKIERPAKVAVCEICGALVVVDPAPVPGEPEILGEGVNRDCTGIDQEWHETA